MNPEVQASTFDIAHLWAQGDAVSHAVAITLLLMSVASWYLMLVKAWRFVGRLRGTGATERFWQAASLEDGLEILSGRNGDPLAAHLLGQAMTAAEHLRARSGSSLGNQLHADEFITRAMRQSIGRSTARLESGLTVLASIGSTAPFPEARNPSAGIPRPISAQRTASARACDKAILALASPLLSVWPVIAMILPRHGLRALATSSSSFSLAGSILELDSAKRIVRTSRIASTSSWQCSAA